MLGEESILTKMSEALLKHIKFQALYLPTAVVGHQFLTICIIPLHRKFKSLKQRFSLIKSLMCILKQTEKLFSRMLPVNTSFQRYMYLDYFKSGIKSMFE